MKKIDFSIALYIIDDSIVDVFEFKSWQNCKQVRFLPWASHFRFTAFFSPALALKGTLNLTFHFSNHPFKAWNSSALVLVHSWLLFLLELLIGNLFIHILLNWSNIANTVSKFSFCPTLMFFLLLTSPDWKALLIFSLFLDSSHVDIVFLGTPIFWLPLMVLFLIPSQWSFYIFQKVINFLKLLKLFKSSLKLFKLDIFAMYKCNLTAV